MWPTRRCCRNCCTGKRPGCGATGRIRARARSSISVSHEPATAPNGAVAIKTGWMKWSGLGTETNRGCAVRSSMCSDEAEVRVREGALQRTGEERPPAVCHLRSGELVYGSQKTAPLGGGVSPSAERSSPRTALPRNEEGIPNHEL